METEYLIRDVRVHCFANVDGEAEMPQGDSPFPSTGWRSLMMAAKSDAGEVIWWRLRWKSLLTAACWKYRFGDLRARD